MAKRYHKVRVTLNGENIIQFDAKARIFIPVKQNFVFDEIINISPIIEFNANSFSILDVDVLFNNEPYYDCIDFSMIEIICQSRKDILAIAENRYQVQLEIKKDEKIISNVLLLNCAVYQILKKSIIIKPNDATLLNEEEKK